MAGMMFRRRALRALALAAPLALLAGGGATAQSLPDTQDLAVDATGAPVALVISDAPTQNVKCRAGVCSAKAGNAVLNAHQLQRLLAKSSVKVLSGRKAKDIHVETALSWVSTNTLTLDAFESVTIDKHVSDAGPGGFALVLNDGGTGGTLSFGAKGDVTFLGTTNSFTIDGNPYALVNTLAALATAIAANAGGNFALAGKINAHADGTYAAPPVPTTFTGNLEGLGNTISNLTIVDPDANAYIGLFADIGAGGSVRDTGLLKANVSGTDTSGNYDLIGALAGLNDGTISGCYATGSVKRLNEATTFDGGLVGNNNTGTILHSHASVTLSGIGTYFGGLVGINASGTISDSYATGKASNASYDGGLAGENGGTISNSYATGAASKGFYVGELVGVNYGGHISNAYATGSATKATTNAGGLAGANTGTITVSYSTGAATGDTGAAVGGLLGLDNSSVGSLASDYWDTTTSGITAPGQGAGSPANDPGITARTTAQLKARLPKGFSKKVWGESASINGGLPYLLALPPS
jgi:The GLUG motif